MAPAASGAPAAAPLERLRRAYRDPLAAVSWDSLDPGLPWLPEELVSLAGLPQWARLDEPARRRLSQIELLAMVDLGLWLESHLLRHLGRAAPRAHRAGGAVYGAQLAELREEAGHSLMFLELLRRAGRPLPALPRPRLAAALVRFLPEGSGLFWAAVLIGETVATELNRRIKECRSLPAAVREISAIHFADEVRHVAYARLRAGAALAAGRHPLASLGLRRLARHFLAACFYPGPALYRAAGLPDARALARAARASPSRAALATACLAPARRFLAGRGILLDAARPAA
ncbi:MAG: diiron oxygenase [Acetobacteraceae bacterium]